jgi:phenylalanyl-tRNA synthetase beta chain
VREQLGLDVNGKQPVLVGEFDMAALMAAQATLEAKSITDVPRVPAVIEDLSIVIDDTTSAAAVDAAIRRAGGALLSGATLFDVYRGEQIGAGKKSLSYTLTYQGKDKTLSEGEVEKLRNKIVRAVETQLSASVRKG